MIKGMTKSEKIKELEEIYKDDEVLLKSELINLEHNNGWIKIESEEDLPKNKGLYFFFNPKRNKETMCHFNPKRNNTYTLKRFTYYQPIEKPKPPIY